MSSSPNVTTPGGFFVGLGGIVCFSVVAAVVWFWVKSPATSGEFRAQQVALGLRAAPDAKDDDVKKKEAESSALLQFTTQLREETIHPTYEVMIRTGRTSCSGPRSSFTARQMPRIVLKLARVFRTR